MSNMNTPIKYTILLIRVCKMLFEFSQKLPFVVLVHKSFVYMCSKSAHCSWQKASRYCKFFGFPSVLCIFELSSTLAQWYWGPALPLRTKKAHTRRHITKRGNKLLKMLNFEQDSCSIDSWIYLNISYSMWILQHSAKKQKNKTKIRWLIMHNILQHNYLWAQLYHYDLIFTYNLEFH